nr:Ycf2 protein [Alopecurus pratensis]QSQ71957.1 Ycf2 protein [Alopecurus pratensis]
MNYEFNK